jgi:hypothetical protein
MLHHVSLEVFPEQIERTLEFWSLLGFVEVPAPQPLQGRVNWVERDGTQIHLIHAEAPAVPARGHVAVVTPDIEEAVARLAAAGFEVEAKRELWDAPRAGAVAPGGHRVELMAAPPPRAG